MAGTEMTQMNIRISASEKLAGDDVLAKYKISPSVAIRRLWHYLANEQSIPPFMADCIPGHDSAEGGAHAAAPLPEAGVGLAARLAAEAGLEGPRTGTSYDELRSMAFEEWLLDKSERGAIHV